MQRFAAFDIDRTVYAGTLAQDFIAGLINAEVISHELPEVQAYHDAGTDDTLVAALRAGQQSGSMVFKDYIQVGFNVAQAATMNTHNEVVELYRKAWKDLGMTTIAISTSPYAVVKPFCDQIGPFDVVIAPMAQNLDGFVGQRSLVRSNERTKGEWLEKIVDLFGFVYEGSIAIGDSASDISMLERVERPIAFQPNAELRQIAEQRKWEIWE